MIIACSECRRRRKRNGGLSSSPYLEKKYYCSLKLKLSAFLFCIESSIEVGNLNMKKAKFENPGELEESSEIIFFSYVFTCFLLGFFGAKYLFIYNNNWVFLSTCLWSENFSVFANPERQKWAFGRKSSILYIYKRKRKVYKLFNFLCF